MDDAEAHIRGWIAGGLDEAGTPYEAADLERLGAIYHGLRAQMALLWRADVPDIANPADLAAHAG